MNAGQLGAGDIEGLGGALRALIRRVWTTWCSARGYGNGEAPAIGHWSWLAAGLPIEVPGFQLDRRCGSGVQAVANRGDDGSRPGWRDVCRRGRGSSRCRTSNINTLAARGGRADGRHGAPRPPQPRTGDEPTGRALRRDHRDDRDRGKTSPRITAFRARMRTPSPCARTRMRRGHGPKRSSPNSWCRSKSRSARVDAITLRPLTKAIAATPAWRRSARSGRLMASAIRQPSSPQAMPASKTMPPAACLVVAEDRLEELGLTPIAVVRRLGGGGLRPFAHGHRPGSGGGAAVRTAWLQLGRYRPCRNSNEAFAPQVLAVLKGWGWSEDEFAPRHPQRQWLRHQPRPSHRRHRGAASSPTWRIEMHRRAGCVTGWRRCAIGGGQGIAAVFERAE